MSQKGASARCEHSCPQLPGSSTQSVPTDGSVAGTRRRDEDGLGAGAVRKPPEPMATTRNAALHEESDDSTDSTDGGGSASEWTQDELDGELVATACV